MAKEVVAEVDMKMSSDLKQPVKEVIKHESGLSVHFTDKKLKGMEKNGMFIDVKDINEVLAKCGLVIFDAQTVIAALGIGYGQQPN